MSWSGRSEKAPHEEVALNNDRDQKRRGGKSAKHGQRLCGKKEHLAHWDWTREHCGWSGMRKGNQSRAHVDLKGGRPQGRQDPVRMLMSFVLNL